MSILTDARALLPRLADAAAEVVRPLFRTELPIEDKSDDSPVTLADKQAEATIRTLIGQHFPDHGIIGEEHGRENPDAEYVWVIDPIDGTGAFISGIPTFGCLIALLKDGVPVLGLLDQPISRERWIGESGVATEFNSTPVHTRDPGRLCNALLTATTPDMFTTPEMRAAFDRLETAAKRCRFGYDCYAYGLLASGHLHLVAEASMKLHDFAALVPIITGAGGVITDWTGAPLTGASTRGDVLASASPALHDEALAILAQDG